MKHRFLSFLQRIASRRTLFFLLFFTGFWFLAILALQPLFLYQFFDYLGVLFPAGEVGVEQRNLLVILQLVMLIVVIPVYILTFVFSWKYSADNPKGDYDPDLVDNTLAECLWWGIPLVLTVIIAVITCIKTIQLDPYRPLVSDKPPLKVQVIALQWKWLFVYPEQEIASLNFLQIPAGRPIHFEICADAPMNSLWIPSLGGQIYAMPAMKSDLHLIANHTGEFRGLSANISGEGFAGMFFITKASTEEEFNAWVAEQKKSPKVLDWELYKTLVEPSSYVPKESFVLGEPHLFHKAIHQYMYMRTHHHDHH